MINFFPSTNRKIKIKNRYITSFYIPNRQAWKVGGFSELFDWYNPTKTWVAFLSGFYKCSAVLEGCFIAQRLVARAWCIDTESIVQPCRLISCHVLSFLQNIRKTGSKEMQSTGPGRDSKLKTRNYETKKWGIDHSRFKSRRIRLMQDKMAWTIESTLGRNNTENSFDATRSQVWVR